MSPDPNLKPLQKAAHCGCAGGCSAAATAAAEIPPASNLAQSDGVPVFVIPTMDCPNEENDIRRAVAGIDGIRSLRFQLSARTVSILSAGISNDPSRHFRKRRFNASRAPR